MKKHYKILFLFLTSIVLLSSCDSAKKRYYNGYYAKKSINKQDNSYHENTQSAEKSKKHDSEELVSTDIQYPDWSDDHHLATAFDDLNTISELNFIVNKKKSNQLKEQPVECGDSIVFLEDGEVIVGKVYEITGTEVKYKRCDNLDGPLYTVQISKLLKIIYQNGTEENLRTNKYYQESDDAYYGKKTTEKRSLWSLGLSIGSFVTMSILTNPVSSDSPPIILFFVSLGLAVAGLILGILALKKIRRNPEIYKGKGFAIAGIVISAVILAVTLLLLFILILLALTW